MVTGLLLWHRFIAVVIGAEMVTGVAEAELQMSLPSGKTQDRVLICCSATQKATCQRKIPKLSKIFKQNCPKI